MTCNAQVSDHVTCNAQVSDHVTCNAQVSDHVTRNAHVTMQCLCRLNLDAQCMYCYMFRYKGMDLHGTLTIGYAINKATHPIKNVNI